MALSKSHYVHKALREAMIGSGIFSTNEANAKMKVINEQNIPDGVKDSYFKMLSTVTHQRLLNDADFVAGKYQCADKFIK